MVLEVFQYWHDLLYPHLGPGRKSFPSGLALRQRLGYLVVVLDVEGSIGVDAGVVDVGPLGEGVLEFSLVAHPDVLATDQLPQLHRQEQAELVGNLLPRLGLNARARPSKAFSHEPGPVKSLPETGHPPPKA